LKPQVARLEVHLPVDTRPEVWNKERGEELGKARAQDDAEKNMDAKSTEAANQRLTETRLRSEQITSRGCYMLGIVRDGRLHLHPISQTHQLRPTLTYVDVFHRKTRRARTGAGDDSDSDDGPPPDPDDPTPAPAPVKKEPKVVGETKEVNVAVRKTTDDKGGPSMQGGLSAARHEMLLAMRKEEEEPWQDLEYCDGETEEASQAFDTLFSRSDEKLTCKSDITTILTSIPGL